MANYQHYQRYRPQGGRSRFNWTRIALIVGILFVVFLIGRAIFSKQPTPTLTLPGDNSAVAESGVDTNINSMLTNADANTNVEENANANNNANVNVASSSSSFSVADCTKVISRASTDQKQIALTFNVGTVKEGEIDRLLAALKAGAVPADFFVRGDVAETNAVMVKKVSDAGFSVYNLSYSYPHFNDLPAPSVAEQLTKADQAIGQVTGTSTKPFFRPPYGEADADVLAAVTEAGYCPVTWTVDALDWSSDYTAEQSKDRVLQSAVPGGIVLMQASNATTADIISDVITQLKNSGFTIVNLETLLT
ncbi:MAG: polysaccharide deacetylase family protein [Patescibacteria group bacterium]